MGRNSVIESRRVLTADFLPNRMVHRNPERQEIASALEPVLDDEQPRNILLHGPPGTGKTTMARYVVEKLKEHDSSVISGCVNCWRHSTRFEVYYNLLKDMGERMLARTGTPTDELVGKFEQKLRNRPVVVILDEADQIQEEKILYDMARYSRTGLIMVANRQNIFYDLDERIRSSLSSRKNIRFQQYEKSELVDILEDRREWGLRKDAISNSQLSKIAANANGDARVAINSLRIAAESAEEEGRERITDDDLNDAVPEAREETRTESIEKLNEDQQILYSIITDEEEVRSRELYDTYAERVDQPKVERTLRKYLQKMEKYGLIKSKGKGTGTKYVVDG